MSDLVERLRGRGCVSKIYIEAADEIERLRAALRTLGFEYHDDDYQVIARRALLAHLY